MCHNYWGFRELPFENVPNPYYFYLSKSHEEALARLIYGGKMRKRGAMLSGEIRLLLYFQLNDRFLMTVMLIGQSELKDNIKDMSQLSQRIAIRYHLESFSFKDTARYILFRRKRARRDNTSINLPV